MKICLVVTVDLFHAYQEMDIVILTGTCKDADTPKNAQLEY
jgi:hypothetical protein